MYVRVGFPQPIPVPSLSAVTVPAEEKTCAVSFAPNSGVHALEAGWRRETAEDGGGVSGDSIGDGDAALLSGGTSHPCRAAAPGCKLLASLIRVDDPTPWPV